MLPPGPTPCSLLFSSRSLFKKVPAAANGAVSAVSVAYRFFHETTGSCANGTAASNCVQFSAITLSSKTSTTGESGESGEAAVGKELDDTILHLPKSDMTNVTGGTLGTFGKRKRKDRSYSSQVKWFSL